MILLGLDRDDPYGIHRVYWPRIGWGDEYIVTALQTGDDVWCNTITPGLVLMLPSHLYSVPRPNSTFSRVCSPMTDYFLFFWSFLFPTYFVFLLFFFTFLLSKRKPLPLPSAQAIHILILSRNGATSTKNEARLAVSVPSVPLLNSYSVHHTIITEQPTRTFSYGVRSSQTLFLGIHLTSAERFPFQTEGPFPNFIIPNFFGGL